MITPAEIQNKAFTRGVRGYKEDEVDGFLDQIIVDLDAMIRENEALRDKIAVLTQENARYRESEASIYRTLDSAKSLMAEISASAEKRAEIVLKNAELDAERIRREAHEDVEKLTEDAVALSRRWELFSARFRNLLETELDRFDSVAASLMREGSATPKKQQGVSYVPVRGIPLADDLPKDGKSTRKF
ncbi:MAG: DivIVA domain-containing protein [Clostridiales Family XIII bacterium]|jgi:cell division initiation protein|nr:DivIVA domain-containing protein [Clostridiales Family XIII bacterium]